MRRLSILSLVLGLTACTAETPSYSVSGGANGKTDTGWVGSTTFEIGGRISSSLTVSASGRFADVATDEALQNELVDAQVKFGKNQMHAAGYELNQLYDRVTIDSVTPDTEAGTVTIAYSATIDVIKDGERKPLDQLGTLAFDLRLPRDPVGSWSEHGQSCVNDSEAVDYSFYYYFDPDHQGCRIPLETARLELTEVYERAQVYPEYDELLNYLGDDAEGNALYGFQAAVVPNVGDDDPLGRFNDHKSMLEQDLGLTGERGGEDGLYIRYTWARGNVRMIIDLIDPTKGESHSANFRAALSQYQLIHYNGHSQYGTKDLLTNSEAYTSQYQIVSMHSCRSYPYYVRQVFRAKATDADPTGFGAADVVAAGESTYPYGSPRTLKVLLRRLMDGIEAVQGGNRAGAPDWVSITAGMNEAVPGFMYGASGVSTNTFTP